MTTIHFNNELFANDLKEFRGDKSQNEIAEILGTNRSTISLMENLKHVPSLELIRSFCEENGIGLDKYFIKQDMDPIIMMMGKLTEPDRPLLSQVIERIQIREKYISIHRRCDK